MKKSILAWLLLAALLLTGCAAAPAEEHTEPETQQTETTVEETAEAPEEAAEAEEVEEVEEAEEVEEVEAVEEAAEPVSEEAEEPAAEEAAEPTPLDIALSLVDHDLSELKQALGEPQEARYEASCSGDGDDGVLEYEGVTVFTYREKDGSAETVIDAE